MARDVSFSVQWCLCHFTCLQFWFFLAFLTWKQQDQLLLNALLSSLSINVLHIVVNCPTSTNVRSVLKCALASPLNSWWYRHRLFVEGKGIIWWASCRRPSHLPHIFQSKCAFTMTFMIWLLVYQQNLTLYHFLSYVVIYQLMIFYTGTPFILFLRLHPYYQHLCRPPD